METSIIEAALAWAIAAYTLPRYVRYRRFHHDGTSARISAYWYSLLLLALALTVTAPTVYRAFDHDLGMPNAARWVGDALILGAFCAIDGFFAAHGQSETQRREQRVRGVVGVVAFGTLALAALLWRAEVPVDDPSLTYRVGNILLMTYLVVYAALLAYLILRFMKNSLERVRDWSALGGRMWRCQAYPHLTARIRPM